MSIDTAVPKQQECMHNEKIIKSKSENVNKGIVENGECLDNPNNHIDNG